MRTCRIPFSRIKTLERWASKQCNFRVELVPFMCYAPEGRSLLVDPVHNLNVYVYHGGDRHIPERYFFQEKLK